MSRDSADFAMWRISSKNEMKRNYLKKRFLATAAVFALVMCICQIQPVKASVERFISYITYHVTILNKDGSKEKIEMWCATRQEDSE